MNIDVPFSIGDRLWSVARERAYASEKIDCPNCCGKGKIRLNEHATLRCKRCDGDGFLEVQQSYRWNVDYSVVLGITIRVNRSSQIEVVYQVGCRHNNAHTLYVPNVFKSESEALLFQESKNAIEQAEFDKQKLAASNPVDLNYESDE